MTQTTYIEPEGFKGTPGEFYRNNTYVMVSGTDKDVAVCATTALDEKLSGSGFHPNVLREIRSNAQLFAASKVLLRQLQQTQGLLELLSIGFDTPDASHLYRTIQDAINENEAAINKALGNLSNTTDNG